jgi:hypothetical protein
MDRSQALEKISKALALLTYQTRAENLAGFFSRNRLAEDLFIPILGPILKAPNLHTLNRGGVSSPYIDLGDERRRLSVQVTAERSAAKITDTLTNFISHGYNKRYKRLVFFILSENRPKYKATSKRHWRKVCGRKLSFNPSSDIISTLELYSLIASLPHSKLLEVEDIIAGSMIGESYIDVMAYLSKFSLRQIEDEKKSTKYIPDVFVETRETKSLARSFAHPELFFSRTLESLGRLSIRYWDRFLDKAGLPHLPFPDLSQSDTEPTLGDVTHSAAELSSKLAATTGVLKKYEELSHATPHHLMSEKIVGISMKKIHLPFRPHWGAD